MKGKYLRKVLIGVVAAVTAFISYPDGRVNAEEVYGDAASVEIVDADELFVDRGLAGLDYMTYVTSTSTAYDENGNRVQYESFEADENTGLVLRHVLQYFDGHPSVYYVSTYDENGNILTMTCHDLSDNSVLETDVFEYDANGTLIKDTRRDATGSIVQYWLFSFEYDSNGNVVRQCEKLYSGNRYRSKTIYEYYPGTDIEHYMYMYSESANENKLTAYLEFVYEDKTVNGVTDFVMTEQKYYLVSNNREILFNDQVCDFDSNNYPTRLRRYEQNHTYVGRSDLECDSYGNVTKETMYDADGVMTGWVIYTYDGKIERRDDSNNNTNNNNSEDNNTSNDNNQNNNNNNNENTNNNQDNNENNNNNTKPGFEIFNVADGCAMQARMYNPNSGEHFYTGSQEEVQILIDAGWNFEGPGFITPTTGIPIYRLYSEKYGDHFYTTSETERDMLVADGWKLEGENNGIAFPSADTSGKPMYRLYNPNAYSSEKAGAHHFTTSMQEVRILEAAGWEFEGTAWYSL